MDALADDARASAWAIMAWWEPPRALSCAIEVSPNDDWLRAVSYHRAQPLPHRSVHAALELRGDSAASRVTLIVAHGSPVDLAPKLEHYDWLHVARALRGVPVLDANGVSALGASTSDVADHPTWIAKACL